MNTTHFVNGCGVTIFRTRMTVKGEDLLISTSDDLSGESCDQYWETMVFHPDAEGEPDFDRETVAEERHYFSEFPQAFGFQHADDAALLEKVHQRVVAAITLYDKGVVYDNQKNEIGDILWAVSRNDFSLLKA